ncbi:MAG: hypothetical protein MZV63_39095 [Marinilabiliales bacterium]|nr:hypothetical protein [Marinilabiliales bacterium]
MKPVPGAIMLLGRCTASQPGRPWPGVMDTVTLSGYSDGNGAAIRAVRQNEYSATTDADGIFIARECSAEERRQGDGEAARCAASPSPAVDATIPFKEISLWSADYFAGVAEGAVAGSSRSKWAKPGRAPQGGTA